MEIAAIHCYLVRPSRRDDTDPAITGTAVRKNERLFLMLQKIFDKTDTECNIDIVFKRGDDGKQSNPSRELLIAHHDQTTIITGRALAAKLQKATNPQSGLALLFVISGKKSNGKTKIVMSRFPADQGILAEERTSGLSVSFIEKVFMKSTHAYKSAAFVVGTNALFWTGKAVDKQINSADGYLAKYWISEFLEADLALTGAAGSRRLAMVLRDAIKQAPDIESKSELAAAATLAKTLSGKSTSIEDFCGHFGLSEVSIDLIKSLSKHVNLYKQQFNFDKIEFDAIVPIRQLELSNGAILAADSSSFDTVFRTKSTKNNDEVEITTIGKVVNQKLRRGRIGDS